MSVEFSLASLWASWKHLVSIMLSSPQGLLWWPTVVTFLICLAWVLWRQTALQPQLSLARISRELQTDVVSTLGYLLTQALIAPLLTPVMVGGVFVVFQLAWIPAPLELTASPLQTIFVAFLIYLIGDHNIYWTHRLFHRLRPLWRLHALHHNAPVLTPLTAFRFWPPETAVHMLAFALGEGLALGLASLVFGIGITPEKVLGANIFALIWLLAFSQLRHSHLPLGYPVWLSYLFVSPVMHQVHHSVDPVHHDKNFGTAFALWDWIYGTLYIPKRQERFVFGL